MKYLLNCISFISLMVLFSFFDNFGMEEETKEIFNPDDFLPEYDHLFKVVFVGDEGVGKTQIINKFVNNIFNEGYKTQTTVNYSQKVINFDGKNIKLELCDTPGQEKYRSLNKIFYNGSHLIVFVYAINNKKSFENIQSCVKDVKIYTYKKIKFLLVGNKYDLEEERDVSTEEAKTYAAKNEMEFVEVSAKDKINIEKMFDNSLKKFLDDMEKEKNNNLTNNNTHNFEQKDLLDDQDIDDIKNKKTFFFDKYCSCCPCF